MLRKATFTAALLLSCALGSAANAKTFVYCSEASPTGFDPGLATSATTYDSVGHTIFNRLFDFKAGSTELEPSLAESYEVSEDGLEYTIHLRKGVKFHTTDYFTPTRDFNADDVLFSFDRQRDEKNPWNKYISAAAWEYFAGLGLNDLIRSIDRLDDHTVKFTLTRREAPFLANIAIPFASIQSKEYADKLQAEDKMEQMNALPIGTGPFSFVDYQQDAVLRYKANPDYWHGAPRIDDLVFAITTDPTVRSEKLQAGECHLASYPNTADVAALKANPDLKVLEAPALNVSFLAYNTQMPPFDKAEVRRALNKALNKEAIVATVFHGAATVAKNPIPPGMWSYNDAVQDDPYDPEAARKELAEAGVHDLSMKIWAMPVSRPYMLNARRAAEMMQADLATVGVKAEIVTYDWAEYLQRVRAKDRDGAVILGWTGDNGDPDNFLSAMLACASVEGNNWAQWCNPEFDALIAKAKEVTDIAERTKLYEQAQLVFKREAPWATLDHSLAVIPMRKNVVGFVQSPLGAMKFDTVDLAE